MGQMPKIESAEKNRMLNSKSDTAEIPVIETAYAKDDRKKLPLAQKE